MSGRWNVASLDEKAQILQQQGQSLSQLQSVAGGIGEEESTLSSKLKNWQPSRWLE